MTSKYHNILAYNLYESYNITRSRPIRLRLETSPDDTGNTVTVSSPFTKVILGACDWDR